VHVGRRLGRARAELSDPSTERLLASAMGTFVRNVQESG
jgi:acyl-coenzyme A thioesterase PaaI-like protein